ncbi:MAG: NAD(P)H-dependent oxidoreductase subunit E [Bacillota bacterium]|nr:NAD(P)H-dependent oxidoreductase subunit E [Bacillota bacterium]
MSLKSTIEFKGTKEQEEKLNEAIAKNKDVPGALIPILHQAQNIYGYLPIEVQKVIADSLGLSLTEVYGVVTFYAQFTLYPKGEYAVGVCLGTACYVKGSGKILEEIKKKLKIEVGKCTEDGKFSLDATRCIGACGLAPVMTVNDEVYGKLVANDVASILEKYISA